MTLRRFLVTLPLLVAVAAAGAITLVTPGTGPPGGTLTFDLDSPDGLASPLPVVLRRRTITPEFDPPLDLRAGRLIVARGPVACDPGEAFSIDLVVTQGDSQASGRTAGRCTGDVQQWTVYATVEGDGAFVPGRVHACAVATTRRLGITDSFQWCADPVLAAV